MINATQASLLKISLEALFTLDEIAEQNGDAPDSTLRFRVRTALGLIENIAPALESEILLAEAQRTIETAQALLDEVPV